MAFSRSSKSPALFVVALGLSLVAPAVRADPLFTQGPPNGNNFDITDYRLADDFSLAQSGTVDEIGFWYQAQFQTDLSAVTYAIYANNSGALGAVLQSGTINTPSTSFDNSAGLFFADFAINPVGLSAGTPYWLEVHAGSSLTDTSGFTVSWGAADDNSTAVALENLALNPPDSPVNVSGFNQYAFVISGPSAVPEPRSECLVLAGLLAALLIFRTRLTSVSAKSGNGGEQ